MRRLLVSAALLMLAGCAHFENRLACTLSGGEVLFVSMYGPVGVASKVKAGDARKVCGEGR